MDPHPANDSRALPADAASNGVSLLHAINEASALIQNSALAQDLPDLLRTIVEQATQLLHAAGGSFYRADPQTQMVFCEVSAQFAAQDYTGVSLHYGEGLAGKVVQSGKALIVDDYRVWPGRASVYEAEQPFCAVICAPVMYNGQAAGALQVIYDDPERRFTQHDLELLTLFAQQAGVAIENARLYTAVATERQHLELIYDISREISSSLNPNEILERAAALTCRALNGLAAAAFLYLADEDRLSLRALTGQVDHSRGYSVEELDSWVGLRPGKGLAGWVAAQRQGAVVADVLQDPRWAHALELDEVARAAISSPISFGDELLGVITVLHSKPGYFSDEHLSLLQAICQSVGVALSNARQHEETQQRLAEITLIQGLAQAFNQRLEVQKLLDEAACQLVNRLAYASVAIYLVAGSQLELRAWCSRGGSPAAPPASSGIVELVARSGEPAMVRGNADARLNPSAQAYVELAVPIFMGKSVVGVISIHSERQGQVSRGDSEIIKVLAGQISVALENAVLYDQLRRQTHELEATVARRTSELAELYDLSQEIAFLYSFPELLQRLLRRLRKALSCDLVAGCLHVDGKSYYYLEARREMTPAVLALVRERCTRVMRADSRMPFDGNPVIQAEDFDAALGPLERMGSALTAPVMRGSRVIGALFAGDEPAEAFGKGHERLLSTFANQASSAAERIANILSEQQQQWEALVEHLPVGVLLLDADFYPLVANPLGNELLQVLNGAPPGVEEALVRLGSYTLDELTQRVDMFTPVEITVGDSNPRVISAQLRPVRAAVGAAAHPWVLMLGDITQEKENLKRLQSQDRLATVGQLAAGIAHDFNNIMATILVYADLLRFDASISDTSQEKLAVIRAQIQRASSLIRQILDFSRRSVIEHVTLDLLPLLKEFDKLLIRVLPETIHLELAYQPGAFWVSGDPTRLQQVLMNLAVNARDAMPQGGKLRFEMSALPFLPQHLRAANEKPAGGWIRIVVSDTGCGIPREVMEHLFEPFYTTKPPGQGTGLGLAQVYGIITQHGGAIDVQTQVGQGTTISLFLPAVQIQRKETGPLTMPAIFDGAGRTVLVAEDDAATREAIFTLLEAAQCNVLAAVNGVDALQKFRNAKRPIDAVISDIVMPEMGGISLYQAIQEISPGVKMLMITGHPLDENNQQMLEGGNIRWLQKPFSISEFSRALAGLFQPG